MKIVSISDYSIHYRLGRVENVGQPYINNRGNRKYRTEFRTIYKTNTGDFSPDEWLCEAKQVVEASGEMDLLNSIIAYCRENCAWLRNAVEKDIEEYAMSCLASGAYTYWENLGIKRIPDEKIFIFERGDFY